MLKNHLKQLGMTDTEVEIYLTVYEYGRLSAGSIARLSGIKRTTVYAAADELAKRGILAVDEGGRQRAYVIEDAQDSLRNFIEKEEKEITQKKQAAEEAIKELSSIPRSTNVPTPKVRVVAGHEIEEFLYKQTPVWEESMKELRETTWWGFQDAYFVENQMYQEWILWYWKRAPRSFKVKLFTNDSEIEKEMSKKNLARRQMRFWETDQQLDAAQWILGDYIVSVVTSTKQHYLTQIHDPIMAQNLRVLYKKLWSDAEEKKKP